MKKLFLLLMLLAVPCITADAAEDFRIIDGVLTEYLGSDSYVEIPSRVKIIGSGAFRGNKDIVWVEIPGSVTEIEPNAFNRCRKLKTVIGMSPIIGEYAFAECSALDYIPQLDVAKEVRKGAFSGCSSLPSAVFDKDLEILESNAFLDCSTLQAVSLPYSINKIGSGAFMNCINLRTVLIDSEKNDGVHSIGERAFYNCRKLEKISLPSTVTEIGPYAFSRSGVSSVGFGSGLEKIYSYAFAECKNLSSIRLPASLAKIYDHAFAECTSLSYAHIPDSVIVDGTAFNGCAQLNEDSAPTPAPASARAESFPTWNIDLAEAYRFITGR